MEKLNVACQYEAGASVMSVMMVPDNNGFKEVLGDSAKDGVLSVSILDLGDKHDCLLISGEKNQEKGPWAVVHGKFDGQHISELASLSDDELAIVKGYKNLTEIPMKQLKSETPEDNAIRLIGNADVYIMDAVQKAKGNLVSAFVGKQIFTSEGGQGVIESILSGKTSDDGVSGMDIAIMFDKNSMRISMQLFTALLRAGKMMFTAPAGTEEQSAVTDAEEADLDSAPVAEEKPVEESLKAEAEGKK